MHTYESMKILRTSILEFCGKNTTYHTFTDGMVENLSNQNIWFCGNEFPLFQCHAFS